MASRRVDTSGDHPRVCGEHHVDIVVAFDGTGSSPRVRGTQKRLYAADKLLRIIPACAGNT